MTDSPWARYDGMGEMIVPGPHGALSTLHFENYRDGVEDHAYLALLRDLVAARRAEGRGVAAAEALLSIPSAIFEAFSPAPKPKALGFSERPEALRAHREKIARAIVSLSSS